MSHPEDFKLWLKVTVFSQLVKLVPRNEFESIVARHKGDARVRTLDCWTWFGALLFGQMTGHDSIRAIERVFAHQDGEAKKLDFGPVRRSTLADANRTRPVEILEELYAYCLSRANEAAPEKTGFRFHGQVFARDSTTIELCLSLSPWAVFRRAKGAVKLHTAIDIAGNIPQFAVIADGKHHDIRAARRHIFFEPGATVVFDKGYIDYAWLNELNQNHVWFVTRMKSNCQYAVMECHLRIKKFLGTSSSSVKAQILVALIAYLLVHLLKHSRKSDISLPDAMAAIGTLLLLREPLSRLLGSLPRVTRHPSGSQLVLNL